MDYLVLSAHVGELALVDAEDVAVDPTTGRLFAVLNNGDDASARAVLVTIHPATGAIQVVTELMGDAAFIEGLTSAGDGTLRGTTGDASSQRAIVTIDPATGAILASFPLTVGADYEAIACNTDLPNTITGSVFADANNNGVQDAGEVGQAGIPVQLFRDVNGNGRFRRGHRHFPRRDSDRS